MVSGTPIDDRYDHALQSLLAARQDLEALSNGSAGSLAPARQAVDEAIAALRGVRERRIVSVVIGHDHDLVRAERVVSIVRAATAGMPAPGARVEIMSSGEGLRILVVDDTRLSTVPDPPADQSGLAVPQAVRELAAQAGGIAYWDPVAPTGAVLVVVLPP